MLPERAVQGCGTGAVLGGQVAQPLAAAVTTQQLGQRGERDLAAGVKLARTGRVSLG